MATLLLTAVGTLVGGPLGGALGALAGQQIDGALIGSGSREGPRLKELAVSTSSYGQAIPRHFGQVRTAGTIIWATDLVESKETSGGGKGKPKVTTFSYSVSFAVALSSNPVQSIGRIWADGNLLRGAAGDLKTSGTMRFYSGHGDQQPDPLIASAQGLDSPAYRDLAYVVFEDLQLGDFGNRIPALTFEVFALDTAPVRLSHLLPVITAQADGDVLEHLLGFSDEGGRLESTLSTIAQVYPIASHTNAGKLAVSKIEALPDVPAELASEVMPGDAESGQRSSGRERSRQAAANRLPHSLRYYDRDRDYQAGIQLARGQFAEGQTRMVELPATLAASSARALSLSLAQGSRWQKEQIKWRMAELDPSIGPGSQVSLPGIAGRWMIESWEWLDRGVELALERMAPSQSASIPADAGDASLPPDLIAPVSQIWAFEIPSDGTVDKNLPIYVAAMSASGSGWAGAALYVEQDGGLVPVGQSTRSKSTVGHLSASLDGSPCTHLEASAAIEVDLLGEELTFPAGSATLLASGANRLFVDGEIIQFCASEKIGPARWRLSGLLRGRGGTEHVAQSGQSVGTPMILLDEGLLPIDAQLVAQGGNTRVAAIGLGDDEPSFADLQSTGISLAPLSPVHARYEVASDGGWNLCWTRRARGQWRWMDFVETPLVEELENYVVGAGPVSDPVASWQTAQPSMLLDGTTIAGLVSSHGSMPLWVRQVGTFGTSPPTLIGNLG